MAVVATYDLGYCTVRIHDDAFKDRTREEMDASWHRFSEIIIRGVARQMMEEDRKKAAEAAAQKENEDVKAEENKAE